jgi:Cft2 family RNA processing exonuclease
MQVLYRDGVHLPDAGLWLDPHKAQQRAIVTHAHADHMQPHAEVWSTPATAAMMRLRGATRCQYQDLPFRQPLQVETGGECATVTLYPAGHVLGSAQVLVEQKGIKVLYSGDFKLRTGLSAEECEVPEADIVVMETTFGRPRYKFPDTDQVCADIKNWCWDAVQAGDVPVLFCYSLGKGQELLAGLHDLDLPIYLHSAHWKMANLYRELGVDFPEYKLYEYGQPLDGVLLCASGCRRGKWFSQLVNLRTAYISGWALDSSARWRFGTDAAFPLSDHADYGDLMAYVGLTGAQVIYTMHGFETEFARDLCGQGYHALPLKDAGNAMLPPQLKLF